MVYYYLIAAKFEIVMFCDALAFRIEQVHLTRKDGIAKVLGTLTSVSGASVITLYKGPIIYRPNSASDKSHILFLGDAKEKNWTLGCICLIGHCLFWSSWIVLQSPVLKKYPARLSVVSYSCFFSVMQFLAIAAYIERDSEAWQFNSSWEVFTVFYSVCNSTGNMITQLKFYDKPANNLKDFITRILAHKTKSSVATVPYNLS